MAEYKDRFRRDPDYLESELALANIRIRELEETLRIRENDLKYWRAKADEAIDSYTRLRWPDTTGQ